ncbi:MLO-like protein 12 isoform X2 [Carya illinoinensis]|uniref:MLO-like protein 12 isoform X2 n=1 Tax=Carya illinoinensis TaxID=32201 RepID=UPI001C727387|nr:MLO-like protein 12 isoform X2 [Carya illinoinensis]
MDSKDLAPERTMEKTPTWAVAVVCFVLIVISIFIEHIIHVVEHWLKHRNKRALGEALEKIKADPVSGICISKNIGDTWHPCDPDKKEGRKLLQFLESGFVERRRLAKGHDKCADRDKVAFMSAYAIHQLHIFIFVLALFHVLYCIITMALGRTKMRKWKAWEVETQTLEYQYYHNDPDRFRFARDTSFGRRHLNSWSRSTILLWIVCFFRQFWGSVKKVDYLALRHGFIVAHLTPDSGTRFNFQKYIKKSLEEDFVVVVGISPILWFFAVLYLLSNPDGWYSYLWLPFIPLIIILLVGAKLHMIITEMGLRILERGDVVKGTPVVQPGDDLFWFGNPRFILFLIHLVLFQNAFQLAFFVWSMYASKSVINCFHPRLEAIVIRVLLGVIIQFLCSYVTLPLYALVTQMGSTMKPTIFNDRVAKALKNWSHGAKKKKHGHRDHYHSEGNSPFSSRPASPTHGMSPVHLLHSNHHKSVDSLHTSPRKSDANENDQWDMREIPSISPGSRSRRLVHAMDDSHHYSSLTRHSKQEVMRPIDDDRLDLEPSSSSQLSPPPGSAVRSTQHEIDMAVSDFSFRKLG